MDNHHHHPFREHEHHHRDHTSSVIAFSFKSDWDDKPFTNEDLQTIEAALQSTFKRPLPSSSHNHDDDNDHNSGSPDPPTGGGGGGSRRKLPSSILASQDPNPFSLSPCRANLRMRYLVMKFAGQITYSRTVVEMEAAAMELLKTVEAKNREVGEWRPTFKKDECSDLPYQASSLKILSMFSTSLDTHQRHPPFWHVLSDQLLLVFHLSLTTLSRTPSQDYHRFHVFVTANVEKFVSNFVRASKISV
ncbi:uncharacterized protein LOC107428937 isoform X2 [Ziziphus jujuba]|uniref:Uncharacterized protein LOC107428937 isoform X2 n=1 Tax=Ziziphus jujuba TaxID=326968 RepID=A0ABM3ZYW2_ZIZJJ|nr:uncharacterized protein LOC107428937 isoform X2 [Ziziphus jujuba]